MHMKFVLMDHSDVDELIFGSDESVVYSDR